MRKLGKILVPIDFSEESARALRYALTLPTETKAELIALHVVEARSLRNYFMSSLAGLEDSPCMGDHSPIISIDGLLRERTFDLSNFIDKTVQGTSPVKITKKLRIGSLVEEIATTAQEENVDLVVLELRNRFPFPGLAALRLLKIVRGLPCPVLLDPPVAEESRAPRRPLSMLHHAR